MPSPPTAPSEGEGASAVTPHPVSRRRHAGSREGSPGAAPRAWVSAHVDGRWKCTRKRTSKPEATGSRDAYQSAARCGGERG